ncbi:hypothetical protein LTS18_002815, partial [Coniosporium uncinatum]
MSKQPRLPQRERHDWLQIKGTSREWQLLHGLRLKTLLKEKDESLSERPLLLCFVGNGSMDSAARAAFPGKISEPRGPPNFTRIDVCRRLADASPVLLARLQDFPLEGSHETVGDLVTTRRTIIDWLDTRKNRAETYSFIADQVYGRLVFPFSDVVCLFADDFAKAGVGAKLARWAELFPPSSMIKPRLVIVASGPQHVDMLGDSMPDFTDRFSSIRVEFFDDREPTERRYLPLEDILLSEIECARRSRVDQGLLFTSRHFCTLFEKSMALFGSALDTSPDLVGISREHNEVGEDLVDHVVCALRLCVADQWPKRAVASFIASALVLDSFPPGMHRFRPQDIFQRLYNKHFEQAFAQTVACDCSDIDTWMCLLEDSFTGIASALESSGRGAAALRVDLLRKLGRDWSNFKSFKTCLVCLRRKPEHVHACGHALCDVCVRIFGIPRRGVEYFFDLPLPPTAFYRTLTVDGGGIRGCFSLQALSELEREMNHPFPLQDEFDLAIGTSSGIDMQPLISSELTSLPGGLIVLLMFLRRKSIQHCIEVFDQLAKRTFSKRALSAGPISRRIPTFMATWLKDGKYDPRPFESCLLEAFGEGRRMFDAADGAVSGTKVAVTAVTTRHSKLCILSNYNGLGPRPRGYKHFRADSFADEVLMRDAAQATSAAPSELTEYAYFPVKFIPCLGWLQDGGVGKHNNPVDPAVWEGSAIWNTRQDLLVSIGTAFTEDVQSPTLSERKRKRNFRDGFLWRVLDYFLASGDSQTIWEEHWNRLDAETRKSHFRISAPLRKAPGLDEVDEIPNLKRLARTYMASYDLSSIYRAMIAASFFFELDVIPKFNHSTG